MSAEDKGEAGLKKGLDLDDILVHEVGQVGRYQLTILALVAFPVVFSGFTGEYVFTTARIPTRCLIPQCDGAHPAFTPLWAENAIPVTSSGAFDQCSRFSNSSYQGPVSPDTCPASLFNTASTEPCEEYVYENTHSVVHEFGLACDEWRRSLIGSVRVMGDLLVLPITGYISDRWGRRVAITINAFNLAWTGFARSFVNSYELFLAFEVLESAIGAGTYSSCYILVAELFGPKYRVAAGASLSTMFAIGQVILGFIAWGVPYWRTLTRVIYGPLLLVIFHYWLLTESVRWLLSKGRYEEAEKILKNVAKKNKKHLSDKSLEALRASAEAEKTRAKPKEVWLPLQVLRSRVILSRCCVTPIWWITTTLVYYGMSINAVNLSGNPYLNYAIVAAVEIPGYWTAILLLDRIGRKAMMISAYGICAICQFTFAFSPAELEVLNMAVYLIGKYCISIVVTSMYVYTAELYPTKYRHNLFAFSSMLGRVGSITAPLTPALALNVWESLPSVMFGSFALLSATLVFTTPETLGTKLPDTMEDAENLASRKTTAQIVCGKKSSEDKGEAAEKKNGIDLDTILIEEVGQFGRYQLLTLALAALPVIFSAFASGEYIFTTARIPSRCHIPQCDGDSPEFAPSWKGSAIPTTSSGAFDQCLRFSNSSSQVPVQPGTCPSTLFDTSSTQECETYVYQNMNSVVYDFNLACDEWSRSQIGSIRTIGTLLVLPITGYISDRWGRRVALTINAFNTGWIGLVRSFVNSYEWFLALEVIESAVGAGAYSSCYILVTELVGPKYRVIAGATISTLFAVGQVILGFIAWGMPEWRSLTQILYAPQLLVVSYFWILSESVRWLMSKGRYEESEEILKKVAKRNKRELSDKSLEALRASAEEEKNREKSKEQWLPILVFKSRVLLSRCCVTPIWWITTTLVYYGMNINAVNLSGNSYLNFAIVAAIEIPGYWTAILLLDRIGRKPVLICAYTLCAVCQFTFAFLPEGMDELSLAMYLIGKYSIAVVMTSVYVYTAELYPTKYRHNLFAFSSMVGRLGSITAPLTPALAQEVWESLPSVLFGSFALLSGLLILTTPETLGTKLPDTIEDAENLGKKTVNSE